MHPQDVFTKEWLEPADIEELRKTREGRLAILAWIQRERVCAALAELTCEGLMPELEKDAQERAVWIVWRKVMGNLPVSEIMHQLELSREAVERFSLLSPWTSMMSDEDMPSA